MSRVIESHSLKRLGLLQNTFAILCFAAIASACDPVVDHKVYRSEATRVRQEVSCTYASICYECGLDWEGDYSCGFRYSLSCDGRQPAQVDLIPVVDKHESGKVRQYTISEIVQREGSCR